MTCACRRVHTEQPHVGIGMPAEVVSALGALQPRKPVLCSQARHAIATHPHLESSSMFSTTFNCTAAVSTHHTHTHIMMCIVNHRHSNAGLNGSAPAPACNVKPTMMHSPPLAAVTHTSWLGLRKDQPQKPQRSGHTHTCTHTHTEAISTLNSSEACHRYAMLLSQHATACRITPTT